MIGCFGEGVSWWISSFCSNSMVSLLLPGVIKQVVWCRPFQVLCCHLFVVRLSLIGLQMFRGPGYSLWTTDFIRILRVLGSVSDNCIFR